MKSIKLLITTLVLSLITASAQAQVTPQAAIGNAPSLPDGQQWVSNGGHTEAFKTKIAELHDNLARIQAEIMSETLKVADKQSQTPPPTQAQVRRQQRQTAATAQQDYAQQQDMMAQLGITQAEMQKMAKMNEKQIEDFMRQRMAEKGIDPAQFATGGDWEAENRRDREAMAQGEAMKNAQETLEAYLEQMRITSGKIDEARQSAAERIEAQRKSSQPAIDAANAHLNELGGPEEIMRGTITKEQYEARASRVQSLHNDREAVVYRIWTEYIHAAQGHLKFLMPYAQAADDVQAKIPSGATGNAIVVAGQYLNVTASEPDSKQ